MSMGLHCLSAFGLSPTYWAVITMVDTPIAVSPLPFGIRAEPDISTLAAKPVWDGDGLHCLSAFGLSPTHWEVKD